MSRTNVDTAALDVLIREYEAERFTADQNTVCSAAEQDASDEHAAKVIAALDRRKDSA